jgi:hypothetical protein
MIIDATEPKLEYLRRMEEFRQARANKHRERDLHIHIKKMRMHIRETKLKEEEELKQREVLQKWDEELSIREKQLKKYKKKRVTSFYCTQ